jgi:5-methyltetrahydrofolate corrinoid/iron sulfur protein methyltransferase
LILAADNLTITNSTVEKAITGLDPGPIREVVLSCEKAGADVIDINTGPLGKTPEEKMSFVVNVVQEITDLPILLDTANPVAMEAGLASNKKKAIINGFSLEPVKLAKILPLAKKFDADIVGYLLDPNSRVPRDSTERLTIAIEIFDHIRKAGIDPGKLIIDPVIVPLTWDNGKFQAMEVAETIRQLPDVLGFDVATIAGISNLTTGRGNLRQKLIFEKAYLGMLAGAGLSMALVNIFHTQSVAVARACKQLKNNNIFAWDLL